MDISISANDVGCITSRLTQAQSRGVWFEPETETLHVMDDGAVSHLDLSPSGVAALIAAGPVLPVPPTVTMAQARTALLMAGHLDDVQAHFADIAANPNATVQERAALIAWEYGNNASRDSALVAAMGSALGLDGGDIDDLFRVAASVGF